jgi:hypothetical protein
LLQARALNGMFEGDVAAVSAAVTEARVSAGKPVTSTVWK